MNETIAVFCANAYVFLLPVTWIGVAVVLFVLLPMACFRSTRSAAGSGLICASWVFGATTWFLGATVTFATWGWIAVLIGLLLGGVGVVPIGILVAFFSIESMSLGVSLIVMVIIVFATRLGGVALRSK